MKEKGSMWKSLVKNLGEDGAKAEMKRRRSLVKRPGFASMDKQKVLAISKKANEVRRQKAQDRKIKDHKAVN